MQALFVSSGATQGQHQRRSRPSRAAGDIHNSPGFPAPPASKTPFVAGRVFEEYAGADPRRGLYEVNRDRRMVIARIARFDVQRRRCEKESGAGRLTGRRRARSCGVLLHLCAAAAADALRYPSP